MVRGRKRRELLLSKHLRGENPNVRVPLERRQCVARSDDVRRVLEVTYERCGLSIVPGHALLQRIELLDQRDQRMYASHGGRSILFEVSELTQLLKFVVHE